MCKMVKPKIRAHDLIRADGTLAESTASLYGDMHSGRVVRTLLGSLSLASRDPYPAVYHVQLGCIA